MQLKNLFLVALLSGFYLSSMGQTCPPNIDFELGNTSVWNYFMGSVSSGPVYTLASSPATPTRHTLMTGPAVDAFGGFPVVGDGSYSLQLGDSVTGALAERARYFIHVPASTANFSLIYRYAIVFQDPGNSHLVTEKPRFEVNAYDSTTTTPLACVQYAYIVDTNLPGFHISTHPGFPGGTPDVWVKPWTTSTINLSGHGGTTVTIDFTAADCTQGGHWGYGYIDMSCGLFQVSNSSCDSINTTLHAPDGYQHYRWVDSATYTHLYDTTQNVLLPTPGGRTTYAVILIPYAGFGCPDTLYTVLYPSHLVLHGMNDTVICPGTSITLTSGATDIIPMHYSWSPATNLSCATCANPIASGLTGTTVFTVNVVNDAGCSLADTVSVTSHDILMNIPVNNNPCFGMAVGSATVTPTSGKPPYSYVWSTIPAQTTTVVSGLVNGTYTVTVTDSTGCSGWSTCTITSPPPTVIAIIGHTDPTTCGGHDGTITLNGFVPGVTFTVNYYFNGVFQTLTTAASASGIIVVSGLVQGSYTNFSVVGTACPYNVVGPVVLRDPPIPPPPPIDPAMYCQFWPSVAMHATGANILWYDRLHPVASSVAPIPSTAVAGVDTFYATQTIANCVSDSAMGLVIIKPKPGLPLVVDTSYCQFSVAPPVTAIGAPFATLHWFSGTSTPIASAPVPSTDVPGTTTWFVSQTVSGCPGDSLPVHVTILYLPKFDITPSKPLVCQFDSIMLAYLGPGLVEPEYTWTLPNGSDFARQATTSILSTKNDSFIIARFDTANQNNYVYLKASDYKGRCYTIDTVRVKVIPQPSAQSLTKHDVCLGDTVSLALDAKTSLAATFIWQLDNQPLLTSDAITIIAHESTSGGPLRISWIDSGKHIIQLNSFTIEGCKSKPSFDSINVHAAPDATFKYSTRKGTLCVEDSVLFTANTVDYNYEYAWAPEHSFNNINKASTWGKVELDISTITLTVTDPFGCEARESLILDPNTCCTITFPNAFTPNGDKKNDVFRPIYSGFHRFHSFRVVNRWGQVVFECANTNPEWDGNFNGVPQDMGVYYFYIKYDCGGNTMEEKGDVTLVR